ncbi:MAG: ATP synthase subunit I [Candidatus Binatus sp.]|uniref:ATP synthase subunit I n=1 Tax=Candidatus Binatus sp. TaxID=2811406 RepID=UPI003BAFC773
MIEVIVSRIVPYAVIGASIGVAYFAALGWNVRLYADNGAGPSSLLLHLARIVVAVAAFTLCAKQGAMPLLACFAGFLAIRTISVNRNRLALAKNL